ncbi:MAG: hypothetical protein P4K93_08755 [Terracidiphilus sp.]|nr:hypothetical protein [Terracidiphilus sp.]MDR3798228.1 hypothetical protein [Terracidiphilus sp.]
MNNDGLDREKEFFVTGVKTYVEVDDAMAEFRSLVQQKCRSVVSERLVDLNQACGTHWTINDLNDYLQKTGEHQYIGKQMEVKGLGGLYFCLRLSRGDESKPSYAYVFLYRIRRDLAAGLWGLSSTSTSVPWKGRNNLGFGRPLPVDEIPNFEDYLGQAATDFLAFINESGGLRKHLAQGA